MPRLSGPVFMNNMRRIKTPEELQDTSKPFNFMDLYIANESKLIGVKQTFDKGLVKALCFKIDEYIKETFEETTLIELNKFIIEYVMGAGEAYRFDIMQRKIKKLMKEIEYWKNYNHLFDDNEI